MNVSLKKDIKSYLYFLNSTEEEIIFPQYYQGYYFLYQFEKNKCYCLSEYDQNIYICERVTPKVIDYTINNKLIIYQTHLLSFAPYDNNILINQIKELLKNNYRQHISELIDSINLILL